MNLLTNVSQWEEGGRLGDGASSLLLLTDQIRRRAAQQPIARATRFPLRKSSFLCGRGNLIRSQQPLGDLGLRSSCVYLFYLSFK